MKKIIDLDKALFVKINHQGANDLFDTIMPFLRVPTIWVPFYLFLLIFVLLNFKKRAIPWILMVAATASVTDLISSRLIKPWFGRLRPCNDPDMASQLRLLADYCGQNGSFTSSHAANHFGMAMFLFITLKDITGNWRWLFFVWAAAICYAQIYVGVHFPLDILGGAVFGSLVGYFSASLYLKIWKPLPIGIM